MITEQESNIIRYERSFAMFFIVLCHILQAYDNRWAWIFNVGVQIFLAISGWLYGNKHIVNWYKWYKDKFFKLYIPYIIYVFIIYAIYFILSIDIFTWKKLIIYILDLQWILGGVKGLSHLWFMTSIAMCYALTPLLQFLKKIPTTALFIFLLIAYLNLYIYKIHLDIFQCLFVFSFTYLYANTKSYLKHIIELILCILFIYTMTTINWSIIIDYTNNINKLFHIVLGIISVILPIKLFKTIITNKTPSIIKWFDKQSYYIYLTHHIFLLGPISLAFCTSYMALNIVIILILTIASAIVLKYFTTKILYIFNKL